MRKRSEIRSRCRCCKEEDVVKVSFVEFFLGNPFNLDIFPFSLSFKMTNSIKTDLITKQKRAVIQNYLHRRRIRSMSIGKGSS